MLLSNHMIVIMGCQLHFIRTIKWIRQKYLANVHLRKKKRTSMHAIEQYSKC